MSRCAALERHGVDIVIIFVGRVAQRVLARSVFGSVNTERAGLQAFIAETGVDEVMIVSDAYEHQARLRSIELIAEAMTQ